MTTNYTDSEIRLIAKISDEQRIGLLTNCGISRDDARKIMAVGIDTLYKGVEMGEAQVAKLAGTDRGAYIAAVLAATKREIVIRTA
jgi:hypothetical protein